MPYSFWETVWCPIEEEKLRKNTFLQFSECTANGTKCIFPFKYSQNTYINCTKTDSTNGKAWCALKVDSQGVLIPGQWEYCDPSCSELGKNWADSAPLFKIKSLYSKDSLIEASF